MPRKFSRNLSPAKIKENNVHTIHYNTTGLLTCPDWGFQYKFKISCKEQKIDLFILRALLDGDGGPQVDEVIRKVE